MTLEEQADILAANIEGWEDRTLERIGKSIGRRGKMSAAQVKQINNKEAELAIMAAVIADLALVTRENVSKLQEMYGEELERQHVANKPLYDYKGVDYVPYAENAEAQEIAQKYSRQVAESVVNASRTKALCVYVSEGGDDGTKRVVGLGKEIRSALDKAVDVVSEGKQGFYPAMRETIKQLGGSGVRVDYGGGVTRRLDSVVRQSVLYGAKQMSVDYNTRVGRELGCDGVEIDYHAYPRPTHEFMQGRQYSATEEKTINGVVFPSIYDESQGVDWDGSGLSVDEALNDYGCRHYPTPIICGVSVPRYSEDELERLKEQDKKTFEIDGKQKTGYQVSQDMRKLETATREQNRIRDMAKAEGDKEAVKECNERIKAIREKYDDIASKAGITPDYKRMR